MNVLFIPQVGDEQPWLDDLRASLPDSVTLTTLDRAAPLKSQFRGVTVVVDQGGHATSEMIEAGAAAGVRLWQVLGTGVDALDLRALARGGVRVANTPGDTSAVALAEHALLLTLAALRKLRQAQVNLARGRMHAPLGEELCGKTLGIVGLGASGRELAKRAVALGMSVLATDLAVVDEATQRALGVIQLDGDDALARLLGDADVVSLHVPLVEATRRLIAAPELALMKPSAVLVNVARGGLVDEGALCEALGNGGLGGAGIDVFVDEPPTTDSPLLKLPTVAATPHIAGMTRETSRRRARFCAENVERVHAGTEPRCRIEAAASLGAGELRP